MDNTPRCPECGTLWTDGVTCETHFHQMLFWEAEFPELGAVHHLMVASYNVQHPHVYSPQTLKHAHQLLVDFLERGLTPQQVRARDRDKVDSGKRQHKITGTAESHGAYQHPVAWTMTAADVTAGGAEHYCERVEQWARSIIASLRAAGELEPQ